MVIIKIQSTIMTVADEIEKKQQQQQQHYNRTRSEQNTVVDDGMY